MLVLGLGFSSSPNNQNIPRTDRRALLAAATHRTGSSHIPLAQEPLHDLFHAQAKRTPSLVAVLDDNTSLTYDELNFRAIYGWVATHVEYDAELFRALEAGAMDGNTIRPST